AAERSEREPPAHDLPQDRQVGRDPEAALRTAAAEAEAGDHLVEYEQRARRVAERAQRVEEAGERRDAAHVPRHRLDDDRGELVCVPLDRGRSGAGVVVGDDDRLLHDGGRDAGRRRDPERREPRARLREEAVGVAVVAAGEREHERPARRRAREPQGGHRRLRPRRDEPDLLDRGERVGDLLRERDLALGRDAEARSVERSLANGIDGLGVGVAEDQRPPRLHPVEEPPPVLRLEVRTVAAGGEERLVEPDGAHRAHRRADAARHHRLRAVPERAPRQSQVASSLAQYVITTSAPARRIDVSASTAAARSSRSPAAAAAFSMAYSPETLYAASGRSKRSRTARTTSRYGSAGFTIRTSAPSATSSSHSRSASRTLPKSIWYPRRSPNAGADPAASRNGP